MGKRILNLYVEDDIVLKCKMEHINMSALVTEILSLELQNTKKLSEKQQK